MAHLVYEKAEIQDLPVIVEIYNSTIPSRLTTGDLEPVTLESKINWFNEHDQSRRPLWIVKDRNHEVIGWISFQDFYGRAAYRATAEISIYVHQNYRGKGFGGEMLDHALSCCGDFKITSILGYIFAHNEASLKLFYSRGFQDWGVLPEIADLDGIKRSVKIVGRKV